jgi:hypothetical protein
MSLAAAKIRTRGLLLLHGPLTLRVFAGLWADGAAGSNWAGVFILTLTNAIFLAEIARGYAFRLIRCWRGGMVLGLVVLLLHVGVIERSAPALLQGLDANAWLLASGLTVAAIMRHLRSAILRDVRLAASSRPRRSPWHQRPALEFGVQVSPQAHWRSAPLRAPPHF